MSIVDTFTKYINIIAYIITLVLTGLCIVSLFTIQSYASAELLEMPAWNLLLPIIILIIVFTILYFDVIYMHPILAIIIYTVLGLITGFIFSLLIGDIMSYMNLILTQKVTLVIFDLWITNIPSEYYNLVLILKILITQTVSIGNIVFTLAGLSGITSFIVKEIR